MKTCSTRSGLTLIELMAALVIAAMLLTATMSVIGGLWRANAADQLQHQTLTRSAGIQSLVTTDLLNATDFLVTGQQCKLKTYHLLDESALAPQRVPATVTYTIRSVGGRNWLVRAQQPEVQGNATTELVCSGVQSVAMAPVVTDKSAEPAASDQFQVMPAGMNVAVKFDTPGRGPLLWTVWRY